MTEDELGEYVGKKYKLERYEIFRMKTRLTTGKQWFLKFYTEPITKMRGKEVIASVLFPMNSKTKWKPFGKLQSVLEDYGVEKLDDLIGKEVEITRNKRGWLEWRSLSEDGSET